MAEAIMDGTGSGYFAAVTKSNRLMVDISGATINIGSVSASVDSVYVQSGTMFMVSGNAWAGVGSVFTVNSSTAGSTNVFGSIVPIQVSPIDSSQNNAYVKLEYIISGTTAGVTGSSIGSIVKFIGAGSFVKTLGYVNNNLVTIGSFV